VFTSKCIFIASVHNTMGLTLKAGLEGINSSDENGEPHTVSAIKSIKVLGMPFYMACAIKLPHPPYFPHTEMFILTRD
jgi:hypothetical protein